MASFSIFVISSEQGTSRVFRKQANMYYDALYIETNIPSVIFTTCVILTQQKSKNMFFKAPFDPHSCVMESMNQNCFELIVLKFPKSPNIAQNFWLQLPDKMKFREGPKNEQNDANWHHFRAKNLHVENGRFLRFVHSIFSYLYCIYDDFETQCRQIQFHIVYFYVIFSLKCRISEFRNYFCKSKYGCSQKNCWFLLTFQQENQIVVPHKQCVAT